MGRFSFLISIFSLKYLYLFSANWNNFSTSSGLVNPEPWKYVWIIDGKFLKNFCLEYFPFNELYTNCALRLFPVPGLPIIINGILVMTDKNIKNTFSFKRLFLPIPLLKSIKFNRKSSSNFRKSLKWLISWPLKSFFSFL